MLPVQGFAHLCVSNASKAEGRQDTEASDDGSREQARTGSVGDSLHPRYVMLPGCQIQTEQVQRCRNNLRQGGHR